MGDCCAVAIGCCQVERRRCCVKCGCGRNAGESQNPDADFEQFGVLPKPFHPAIDAVGFDKFSFQPQLLNGLDWVRCTYRSVRGPITCNWKRQDNGVALDLHVPVNTSATLILPATGTLTENGHPAVDSIGVERLAEGDGHATFRLESGRYHFVFAASRVEH